MKRRLAKIIPGTAACAISQQKLSPEHVPFLGGVMQPGVAVRPASVHVVHIQQLPQRVKEVLAYKDDAVVVICAVLVAHDNRPSAQRPVYRNPASVVA